jgi:probable HAF family extracellular repeat protein
LGTHSQAWHINAKGQIVGTSGTTHPNLRAFLWENGGAMLDLNTLVPVGAPPLAVALAINDRGEILCGGPNEKGLFLLVPAPRLAIRISGGALAQAIAVEMKVIPGRRYLLEASADLRTWTTIGTSFVAGSDPVTREFETTERARFYRLAVVP